MSDFIIRKAFINLVREVDTFLDKGIDTDMDLFGLDHKKLKDINNLPMILELAKDVISRVRAEVGSQWNDFGWFYWDHADIIVDQIKILEPVAHKMIGDEPLDILEILRQIKPVKILPDGIDYNKYRDIIGDLKLPDSMFQIIFVSENILRKFIIKVLDSNGISTICSLGITSLTTNINARKNEEIRKNYLPIRGSHDIYYLDLKELKSVINNKWNIFRDKFTSQTWISERIDSLYTIRNRVAHNSGSLTNDELKSVETYCREIVKQIDSYI